VIDVFIHIVWTAKGGGPTDTINVTLPVVATADTNYPNGYELTIGKFTGFSSQSPVQIVSNFGRNATQTNFFNVTGTQVVNTNLTTSGTLVLSGTYEV